MKILLKKVFVGPVNSARDPLILMQTQLKELLVLSKLTLNLSFLFL